MRSSNENYLVVYKLKDSTMQNAKYSSETRAVRKYKSLMSCRPKPISISMYHRGRLICFDGEGSHFKRKK